MSTHTECGAVGKFDCPADEAVHGITMESANGEGNVEGPAAWFEPIDLAPEDGDRALIDHYGTRWIIARENSQGTFWVECYDTESSRDERLEVLREAHYDWDSGVL